MAGSLRLDDLLSSLCSEGRQDSSGAFTMDAATALEKLRKFQLTDPFQYCLRWLQAAVAGGALTFNWQSNRTRVKVEMDNFVLDPDRISLLPGLLLDPRASRAEQHLSAGLNAAILTEMSSVRLCSGDMVVTWSAAGFHSESREMGMRGTQIELQRGKSHSFWHIIGRSRDREQKYLHSQAACAPLSLGIQGAAPERRLPRSEEFAGYNESWLTAPAGCGFRPPQCWSDRRYPERCSLYTSELVYSRRHSLLFPIKDGVLLSVEEIFPGKQGRAFLLDASPLKTDLTGLQLVKDEAYQKVVDELAKYLD